MRWSHILSCRQYSDRIRTTWCLMTCVYAVLRGRLFRHTSSRGARNIVTTDCKNIDKGWLTKITPLERISVHSAAACHFPPGRGSGRKTLVWCWPNVVDVEPTLRQRFSNVSLFWKISLNPAFLAPHWQLVLHHPWQAVSITFRLVPLEFVWLYNASQLRSLLS